MIRCAAAGAMHLHRQGIIHSDLGMRNLLVDNDRESGAIFFSVYTAKNYFLLVRVTDFGLAKLLHEGEIGVMADRNMDIPTDRTAPEGNSSYNVIPFLSMYFCSFDRILYPQSGCIQLWYHNMGDCLSWHKGALC